MKRHLCTIFLGIVLSGQAQAQSTDEYKVKAAFLYNFVKFVEWPPQTFKSPGDPIVIGILGKNPFGDSLAAETDGKRFQNRSFQIRQINDVQESAACQIVFISSSERKRFAELLGQIQPSVLTVGDAEGFARLGGVINLKVEGGTVHLRVNLEAAQRQQLHISAKLLSLAEIVRK